MLRLSIRGFGWFFPILLLIQAFIFPDVNARQVAYQFPAIPFGNFNVRVDEAILLIAIGVWGLGLWIRLWQPIGLPIVIHPMFALFAVFAILYLLGAARGIGSGHPNALAEVRTIVLPIIFFFMCLQILHIQRDLPRFRRAAIKVLSVLAVSSVLSAVFPFYVQLLSFLPFADARPQGTFSAVEILAFLKLLYCFALASYLNGEAPRLWYILLIILSLGGQFIWFDKTTFAQIPVITLMLIFFIGARSIFRWRPAVIRRMIFIITGIALCTIFVVWVVLPEEFIQKYVDYLIFRVTRPDTGDITSGRALMWSEAVKMIMKSPLWGYGLGVLFEIPSIYSPTGVEIMHEHNMALWVADRLGLPALFLVLVICIWYAWIGTQLVQRLDGKAKSSLAALLAFTLSMLVLSLTGVHLLYFNVGILFMFCSAAVIKMYHQTRLLWRQVRVDVNAIPARYSWRITNDK